ncbi:putative type-B carboxylesterase lipase family protein [Lyophyllum shimeji]|uniref:Carboxylic ester hydrolase n=1 Tax=Lyophyllum shimeji TaxID=47721 RepID=A0A9P3URG5_LYOSH|nr:putative type-B carboxylesterase lipase family protein [Lyophyllum shimeji]
MFSRLTATIALGLLAAAQARTGGLTVRTHQGDVVGTQASPSVRRFLGIPYAIADRWEAPRPPPQRNESFLATEFGDSCPQALDPVTAQLFRFTDIQDTVIESEDCLSVNIWAPSTERKQKTAVMLWVYGGGFQTGTSNSSLYDGEHLVQNHDDILVVTFNYRTNLLGQPNAPQLVNSTQSQNFGLLDTDAAIQWVYDNIAAFGGDPERITLLGESAGGVTTDAYTFMRPNDTRVKGVIIESGTLGTPVTGAALPQYNSSDHTIWNTLASAVGCGNATDASQLGCMKGVPFRKLIDVALNTTLTFFPVADGITIFADTRTRAEAGNFLKVPVLLGHNAQEGDVLTLSVQNVSLGFTIPLLAELTADITTELTFACPTAQTANDRVQANVSVWRYEYQAVFPDISRYPGLRAYHGSELPLVWGTSERSRSEEEVALSKYMQGAWVAFARDPVNGLNAYGWPQYTGNTSTTLAELGGFYNKTGISFTRGELVDFLCNATDTLLSIQSELGKLVPGGLF